MENNIKNVNNILGESFSFKNDILSSYPVNEILAKNITGPEEYKIIDVKYQKPIGDSSKTIMYIIVKDKEEKVISVRKEIIFKFSENQRVAESLSSQSFELVPQILNDAPPKNLFPSHFISKHSDALVLSVSYDQPKISERRATAYLAVRVAGLNTVMQVVVPLVFKKTMEQKILSEITYEDFEIVTKKHEDFSVSIESLKYIGVHKVKIIQHKIEDMPEEKKTIIQIEIKFGTKVKWITLDIKKDVPTAHLEMMRLFKMVTVNPKLLKGCSPISFEEEYLKLPKQLEIVSMKFIPPEDVVSKRGMLEIMFKYKNEVAKFNFHLLFEKSVNDIAEEYKKSFNGNDFKFLKEYLAPPESLIPDDIKSPIEGIVLKEIEYDYDALTPEEKKISINIISDFRGIQLIFKKDVTFSMSILNELVQRRLTEEIDLNTIVIPKDLYNSSIVKEFRDAGDIEPKLKKTLMPQFYVGGDNNFEVTEVKVTKFDVHSRYCEFLLTLSENVRDIEMVQRNITYRATLNVTYAEFMLLRLKSDDIEINFDMLPAYPPEMIDTNVFKADPLFTVLGVEFNQPSLTQKAVEVSIKVEADDKVIYIVKTVKFKNSREQKQINEWEIEDKLFLDSFDPKLINIHVNILGEPVDTIEPYDLSGIPEGIDVHTFYEPPAYGINKSKLTILLRKGKAEVVFDQIIEFGMNRSQAGVDLQLSHTVEFKLSKKNLRKIKKSQKKKK